MFRNATYYFCQMLFSNMQYLTLFLVSNQIFFFSDDLYERLNRRCFGRSQHRNIKIMGSLMC